MKNAVIGPDSAVNFFVNSNSLRRASACLRFLCRQVKLTVLGERARRMTFRLVYSFWVRAVWTLGLVVPFVDQSRTTVLDPITIRRVGSQGHEYYRMMAT